MKGFLIGVLMIGMLVAASGCGVMVTAEYSRLLDETAALSEQSAVMAENDQLSEQQKTAALRKQATVWKKFQDARDCKN